MLFWIMNLSLYLTPVGYWTSNCHHSVNRDDHDDEAGQIVAVVPEDHHHPARELVCLHRRGETGVWDIPDYLYGDCDQNHLGWKTSITFYTNHFLDTLYLLKDLPKQDGLKEGSFCCAHSS